MYQQQPAPRSSSKALKGCGCALAVAALAALAILALWWFVFRDRGPQPPPASGGDLRVVVLDVEQGDSILIISPSGKAALVDAGNPGYGARVLDALRRHNVSQIDLFITTHAHADHIGAADEVIRGATVRRVLDSKVPNATRNYEDFLRAIEEKGVEYVGAEPGQKYEDLGDGVVFTVLSPIQPLFTKEQVRSGGNEPNANSVVVRLDYGEFSMLLTGDAEAQTEERMIRQGANVKAKVLKVGHHGSPHATSDSFLKEGAFAAAVISCGAKNLYGHPDQRVLDRLRAANVKVFRTDLHGEVTITTRGEGYEIKPEREAKGDVWAGREAKKRDTASSGFIDYGDFGPPPKPKPTPRAKGAAGGR
ncbi:MAG TPA: ComEC/Rec2 family competence protein [Pyrinomonadaceae bacterium]